MASRRQQDDPLVASVRQRDEAAFASLVNAYQPDLLRVCYVILGDSTLAEDAAQSAWMKAWRKIDQLRDPDKVRSWLIAVAANEARQISRSRRPAQRTASEGHFGPDADPRLTDLNLALARLTADERRLLALRYVAEQNSEQIGAAIGTSAGAVRHRLMRLLARLKAELDR